MLLGLLFFLLLLVRGEGAEAGFGITPPYVRNGGLTRNSIYEQKIILVRGDPREDIKANVTINIPGANDWITIDRGTEFILPKGANQVPMVVRVTVPDDAEFKTYKGNIRVVMASLAPHAGAVSIALGAQIDVDLNVLDKVIYDFGIRRVNIADLEEGHKFWWLYFPGKIRFLMQVQNIGNVPAAPSKVVFDIYDPARKNLLETVENTNTIQKVSPFDIKEVMAELPTRLQAGAYHAIYKIYKNEEIIQEGSISLSILPYGTIPGYKGYGLLGLYLRDQLIIILTPIAFLTLLVYGLARTLKRKKRR